MRSKIDVVVALILCFVLLGTRDAYAYLDPGTGSLFIQAIVAALGAGVLAVRMYWHKLKRLFRSDQAAREAGQEHHKGAVD